MDKILHVYFSYWNYIVNSFSSNKNFNEGATCFIIAIFLIASFFKSIEAEDFAPMSLAILIILVLGPFSLYIVCLLILLLIIVGAVFCFI